MQLATWNVNSLNVRLPQVLDWLTAHPVDVLALQELKLTDDKFPLQVFTDAGYHAQWFGQKSYNGVALLSKAPATDVIKNIPGFEDDQSRVLCATIDGVRVIGAYFPNGQEPGSDKFAYKMRWLDALREWVRTEMARHPQLVLMGDYNITFDDDDVWDPEGLRDTIHCTEEERYHLRALIALGLILPAFAPRSLIQDLFFILTEGGPADASHVVAWQVYVETFRKLAFGTGSALAYIMAVATFVLAYFVIRSTSRKL